MTKPVALFSSGEIGDSRHTARLDENSHLVLFLSFSRYITSWAIYMGNHVFKFKSFAY
jgi:hypothetical protein